MRGRSWAFFMLAVLVAMPAATAEEPEDARALWMEQYGDDMVRSVQYSPQIVQEGELPSITIRFALDNNVTDVSGQYCRISNPDPNIGSTCFRAGLESISTEGGTAWTIDVGAQGDEPFPIPPPEAEERLGTQFFITFDDGSEVNFPKGLPTGHPWFMGSQEEFLMWDETQYFGFDVQAQETDPIGLTWLPWALGALLAAGGAAWLWRRKRSTAVALLVVALLLPVGYVVWGVATQEAKAPDFTLTDTGYENGTFRGPQEFSLSDYEGQTVVLDFMAYNCAACRFVTPNVMEPLWEKYGHRDDFTILTIDVGKFSNFPDSNTENLIRWQTDEYDSDWIHALDDKGIFLDYADIGAIGLPSVFIVDGDRNVIFSNSGIPNIVEMEEAIQASFEGQAVSVDVLTVGVLGLALVAGIASFFAPCSVGLIPAYMGFLLNRKNEDGKHHSTIPAGLATAAGIVALYGVLAIVLWIFQDVLAGIIPVLGPIVGGLLVVFGILMLINFDWEKVAKWFGMGKIDGRRGFFMFGLGYGLAAFGCTGPIFLPILIAGFAQGTVTGFLAFGVYALAVASFVVFAAYLVGAGQQGRLRHLLSNTKWITRVSAVLLIGAGAYLIWFDLTAFSVI